MGFSEFSLVLDDVGFEWICEELALLGEFLTVLSCGCCPGCCLLPLFVVVLGPLRVARNSSRQVMSPIRAAKLPQGVGISSLDCIFLNCDDLSYGRVSYVAFSFLKKRELCR